MNHLEVLSDPPPRIMEIKTKINKWYLIKLKSFCTTMEMMSMVREKIIANEATDRELISKVYKQLMKFNTRKTNNPIKNR